MCGFCIHFGFHEIDNRKILEKLKHRGPDEQTSLVIDDITFLHSRLAIQELSPLGTQPMKYGDFIIVFNGEIYNHFELRLKYDLKCLSSSDTETLLHLYEKIGTLMLDELDGMFSFIIYEKTSKKIFFARDRVGEKPLYYYLKGKRLIFASELNVIKQFISLEIEENYINDYLNFGFFLKERTIYKDVFEINAGEMGYYSFDTSEITKEKWWHFNRNKFNQLNSKNFEEWVEENLILSIKRRVETSDLEVGVFLSSGIDSSLVASIAKDFSPNIKSFCVKFSGDHLYDESILAKEISDRVGTNHIEISINYESLANDLFSILNAYGEPFCDSSAIPTYYISKEAKNHVTVILTGDGGDEIFGGYRRYLLSSALKSQCNFEKMFEILNGFTKANSSKGSLHYYLDRFFEVRSKKSFYERYLALTSQQFPGHGLLEKIKTNKTLERFNIEYNQINELNISSLKTLMLLDQNIILCGDLLKKVDIASMQSAIECRTPFFAKEFMDNFLNFPDSKLVNFMNTKIALRNIVTRRIGGDIAKLPKKGFEVPLSNWIENQFKTIINDYLIHPLFICNFIDRNFIQKLVLNKINIGGNIRAKLLWNLLTLEIWYRHGRT